jgi:tRNA-binding EMAP/Myf-like protein
MIRGEESNGMLLAASDAQGVVLLRPDREVEPGSGVK